MVKTTTVIAVVVVLAIVIASVVSIYLLYFYTFSGVRIWSSTIIMKDGTNQVLGNLSLALTFNGTSNKIIDTSINSSFLGDSSVASIDFKTIGYVLITGQGAITEPPPGPDYPFKVNIKNGESTDIFNHSFNVSGTRNLATFVLWEIRNVTVRLNDGKIWSYESSIFPFNTGSQLWRLNDKTENIYIVLK